MADINAALAASKEAIDQLIVAGERTGPAWTASRAPGKWSPSQIVEHVARALEESANVAAGRPSKFPKLPTVLHPVVRGLLFKRVLKKARFPKARTNKAMDPASGPATPAEGRARLETAHEKFDEACRRLTLRGERMRTTIFGAVHVEDTSASWNSTRDITVSRWPTVVEEGSLMAYDDELANRIRQVCRARSDIAERKMFGGLAFLCRGRMCFGIVGSDLMVRVPDDEFDAIKRERQVRPMDFTGKPLRGFVYVSPPGFRTAASLRAWLSRGLRVAEAKSATPAETGSQRKTHASAGVRPRKSQRRSNRGRLA